MPLAELEGTIGLPAPRLLPFSGLALGAGVLLGLLGLRATAIFGLGAIVALYGLLALTINRNRAGLFRQVCYRTYVRRQADALTDEDEDED